jgi:cytochrome c-type biogenesis protein CcmE
MKKIHIFAVIMLVVALGVVLSTVYESETYAGFEQARQHSGKEFRVIGALVKDKEILQQVVDGSLWLSFYMTDNEGVEQLVYFQGAMPQDFEKSEQVVLVGGFKDDAFFARNLLLKCPSKYKEGELEETSFDAN